MISSGGERIAFRDTNANGQDDKVFKTRTITRKNVFTYDIYVSPLVQVFDDGFDTTEDTVNDAN